MHLLEAGLLSPLTAIGKLIADWIGKREKIHVHVKTRSENAVLFWATFLPKWPGEPVWARVTFQNARQRVSALWPSTVGLPFGVAGNASEACFTIMQNAREAALIDGRGISAGQPIKITPEMLARWGQSDHLRACFGINLEGFDPRTLKRSRIEIAAIDQKGVRARKRIRLSKL